jgi:hypothetical protein
MTATPHGPETIEDIPERRAEPQSGAGALPDPGADLQEPQADVEPDVSADESTPPDLSEPEGDSASPDPEPDPETESDPGTESFIREIPGGAGHGPARAYGYISVAVALGATAELTAGGTRSTSRNPLQVTVSADPATFSRVNEIFDEAYPVAEQTAAARRAELRKSGRAIRSSYDVSLATRAVLGGFLQGVASALREPGTTRPAPFREATRARLSDESQHRYAIAAGRAWARRELQGEAVSEEDHASV